MLFYGVGKPWKGWTAFLFRYLLCLFPPKLELAKLANLGIWEVLWQKLAALDGTVLDGKRHVLPRKGMGIFVINWG